MDEACAIARVQVDSKPEIMDRLERLIFQLGTLFLLFNCAAQLGPKLRFRGNSRRSLFPVAYLTYYPVEHLTFALTPDG